ncbi:WLM-domain-containing protein [Auriscalpium vulgare]|uniref:WLM-domain-containing protein n=1 Tax=Auriscalpium vulgare TaxID=40419 RepID=A0ACB8S6P1_9AGAM|nr:WLM-domain-containing protein [Auriscalpium vulgare]
MSETFILSYETLKDRPRANEALAMLQKIASLVKPIMRKHGWRLPCLAEFFPDNPNLLGLNINGGQKILVRLRPAWTPETFLPEEDVLSTMLHELTHNVHGPHDGQFYKFLSGLEDEYAALKRSGYSGEGFFTKGYRLGAGVSHNIPPHVARLRAIEAAERRQNNSYLTSGGGRLGGGTLSSLGLSPRELAVLAADMRAADEKRCASGSVAQAESDKAARDSVRNNAADLADWYDDDEIIILNDSPSAGSSKPAHQRTAPPAPQSKLPKAITSRPPPVNPATRPITNPPAINSSSRPLPEMRPIWTCPACTLINEPHATQCDACMSARPLPQPIKADGWTCTVCGEEGMEHQFWTCRFCGSVKAESVVG